MGQCNIWDENNPERTRKSNDVRSPNNIISRSEKAETVRKVSFAYRDKEISERYGVMFESKEKTIKPVCLSKMGYKPCCSLLIDKLKSKQIRKIKLDYTEVFQKNKR